MRKILIFGNSGSGKTTLAKQLSRSAGLEHLDLDVLAWADTDPPTRAPMGQSDETIKDFINTPKGWVIEGCYSDLLSIAAPFANEIIYLNLPPSLCIKNAQTRAWEPHKYESKAAQDANLAMLVDWIDQYSNRQDTFSEQAHQKLFDEFSGVKKVITQNRKLGDE